MNSLSSILSCHSRPGEVWLWSDKSRWWGLMNSTTVSNWELILHCVLLYCYCMPQTCLLNQILRSNGEKETEVSCHTLYYSCNRAKERWGVQIHVQAFIKQRRGQNTGRVKHQLTDMLWTRHEYSKAMRDSSIGEQYPKCLDKRGNPRTREIVQAGANRVQMERRRVNPENTGKNQNPGTQTMQD